MPEHIGKKIKKIRDGYNLSQDRFAKRIGLSGKTISAYERGRTSPPLKVLDKISSIYNTPIVNMNDVHKYELRSKINNIESELLHLKELLKDRLSL